MLRLLGVGHDAREESADALRGWVRDRFEERPAPTRCSEHKGQSALVSMSW